MNYPDALNNFLKKIKDVEGSLHLVVLYGSYARGDSKSSSDIDILIVLKKYDKVIYDKIMDIVENAMAEADYNELLSPHIIDIKHYQKMKEYRSDLCQSIEDEGKILWNAA